MDPRPAATVVVARPGTGTMSVEILVLERSASSRFAPGYVVFPGGVVESDDGTLARLWFGDDAEVMRACAVRELAEETGLVMVDEDDARPGWAVAPGRLPDDGLVPLLRPPRSDRLAPLARWTAPSFLPVRFDAAFFAVAAPRGLDPVPDGVEIARGWWARPGDVLDAERSRDRLLWPTLKTLEALVRCRSVDDVLALRVEQVPPPVAD
jgi:8-oxo-dGTP pyrophosphatase MutT (NUDIX family)